MTSATRPFGHTGEDALDACMRELRRLRSQQPRPAPRHRARAPLRRFRRPQSDAGDARGPGQAQWPAARRERGAGRALARARRSRGDPRLRPPADASISTLSPASRRRRRRSPTTSPITRTTSTTACGRACSSSTKSARVPFIGAPARRDRRATSRPRESRVVHELVAARHHPLHRGRDRRNPARGSRRRAS